MADLIQFRRDTLENWQAVNPILAEGELGLILDKEGYRYKIGDGVKHWNDLPLGGFNGNIETKLGNNSDSVISQKGITEILKYIVNNNNAVNIVNSFNELNSITTSGIYMVCKINMPVCYLIVCWNSINNTYSQFILGSIFIDSNKNLSIDDEKSISIIYRNKFAKSSNWDEWRYFQESFFNSGNSRPTSVKVGYQYFDITLNKPIWWNGSIWVDAIGQKV